MTAHDLFDGLAAWGKDHGYSSAGISVASEDLTSAQQLEELLQNWNEGAGWIARQSGVIARPDDPDDPTLGWVVGAELALGQQTLQVRRNVSAWTCITLSENDTGDCLTDDVTLLTVEGGAARYRRYWRVPEDGAVEIFACRFVAFDTVENIEGDA